MDTSKNPRSNQLVRLGGIVVAVGLVAFYLFQQFGPAALPKCDADETRTALQEMLDRTEKGAATGAAVEQVSESAFDEGKEIRTCAAVAKFAGEGEEKLAYTVAWQAKDDKKFLVYMLSLPRCDRTEVQGTLKELIVEHEQTVQPPKTLAAIEQIAEAGLDQETEIRACTGLAKFEGGTEQKLSYTVKWNDPEKTQYAVDAEYLP
jgi:hypothetical protein